MPSPIICHFFSTARPTDPTQQTDPLPLPFHGNTQQPDTDPTQQTQIQFAQFPLFPSPSLNATDPARRDRPKGFFIRTTCTQRYSLEGTKREAAYPLPHNRTSSGFSA
ncbi:uncharacterized protein LOC126717672 [Quercus robur]|uniref:uncharacterized protein LOC126717672 n=1 Tax=Quercus robur TaxID=38942 RepID=UPI00216213BF|nr:uncharacterized protein LOC126717672 [Quercus robur]